jgi:hypothetical protein
MSRMTRQQQLNHIRYMDNLNSKLGLGLDELDVLCRCERQLNLFFTRELSGEIRREEITDIPYYHSTFDGRKLYRARDTEKSARKRIAKIIRSAPGLAAYIQTDPRGCCLYIYRVSELGDRKIDEIHSSIGYAIAYPR